MTQGALSRAAQCLVLAFALTGFVAFLLDATPAFALDESESEREVEVEGVVLEGVEPTPVHPTLAASREDRELVHAIREAEVLVTRNITFRIDRPPPA